MSGLDCIAEELRRALGLSDPGPRRRIVDVDVQFLSLVPRGANKLPVLYKSDEPAALEAKLAQVEAELARVRAATAPRDAAAWAGSHNARDAALTREEVAGWLSGARMAARLDGGQS